MNATASSFSMTVILNSPQMQKKKKVEYYQTWIGLPIARTTTLLKQCGIRQRTEQKTTTNQRTALNVFQEAWQTIPEETRRKIAKEHTGRMELITRIADFKTH